MTNRPARPSSLFISFSGADRELKDELLTHLAILRRIGTIEPWDVDQIRPGNHWKEALDNAIAQADQVLILLSANFLAADFVQDIELPKIFSRRASGGLRLVPILLKSCLWTHHPWLGGLEPLPKNRKPLAAYDGDARAAAMTAIAVEIAKYFDDNGSNVPATAVPADFLKDDSATSVKDTKRAVRKKSTQAIATAYLSYAHNDIEWARQKAKTLHQAEIRTFYDAGTLDEAPGRSKKLQRRLKTIDRFFLGWSRHAATSDWVRREYLAALSIAESRSLKRFIVIDRIDDTKVPEELAMIPLEPAIFRMISNSVEITIKKNFDAFTIETQQQLRNDLAEFLDVAVQDIRVVAKRRGSTKVVLVLPSEAADKLLDAEHRPPKELGIAEVRQVDPTEIFDQVSPTAPAIHPVLPSALWSRLPTVLSLHHWQPMPLIIRAGVSVKLPLSGSASDMWSHVCTELAANGTKGIIDTIRIVEAAQQDAFSDALSRWAGEFIELLLRELSGPNHSPLWPHIKHFVDNEHGRWERLYHMVETLKSREPTD